jgi:hypothetical protein
MGRRRPGIGTVQGAGGRRLECRHPLAAREYQLDADGGHRARCRRCGAPVLALERLEERGARVAALFLPLREWRRRHEGGQ